MLLKESIVALQHFPKSLSIKAQAIVYTDVNSAIRAWSVRGLNFLWPPFSDRARPGVGPAVEAPRTFVNQVATVTIHRPGLSPPGWARCTARAKQRTAGKAEEAGRTARRRSAGLRAHLGAAATRRRDPR